MNETAGVLSGYAVNKINAYGKRLCEMELQVNCQSMRLDQCMMERESSA